jgi:hypothetical protein
VTGSYLQNLNMGFISPLYSHHSKSYSTVMSQINNRYKMNNTENILNSCLCLRNWYAETINKYWKHVPISKEYKIYKNKIALLESIIKVQ